MTVLKVLACTLWKATLSITVQCLWQLTLCTLLMTFNFNLCLYRFYSHSKIEQCLFLLSLHTFVILLCAFVTFCIPSWDPFKFFKNLYALRFTLCLSFTSIVRVAFGDPSLMQRSSSGILILTGPGLYIPLFFCP